MNLIAFRNFSSLHQTSTMFRVMKNYLYSLFEKFGNFSILRFIFTFLFTGFGFGGFFLASSIGSLHFSHVLFVNSIMVDNGFWVVLSNNTATPFLNRQGCFPWLINVFFGKFGQFWNIFSDVVSYRSILWLSSLNYSFLLFFSIILY